MISDYTRLKPSGKGFTGLCPFHADKTPSFSVTPAFQSYRCWACGEKGDVFTFVQKKENLSFIEALEVLARKAGVPFDRSGFSSEQISERQEMLELNSIATGFFLDRFARSQSALDYLNSRSILKQTQDHFDIGYAPAEWDALANHLAKRHSNLALAAKIGLLRERKESSGYVDYYRNRLMFPIHDLHGNVVGFGGRAMGDEQPKYLNSPQSDVFNKSHLLYGLYFARQSLRTEIPPVFVEGYTDVVTAHQAGFEQCIATLGTAMTEDHAQILVRYSKRVILCYDGDSAGIKATLKGAEIWEQMKVEGAELLVARLPAGDDPDSILKRGDSAGFQRALDEAVPRIEYQIESALRTNDTSIESGRASALSEIVPVLATIRKRSVLDRYVQRVARLHEMYNFNVNRALESILADVQEYRARSAQRTRGYKTVEEQNGGPLEQPPTVRPPINRTLRATEGFNPNTTNWQRAGERNTTGEFKRGYKRNEPAPPPSDRTPPHVGIPALSAADKAERTLLRALMTADWHRVVADNMQGYLFASAEGREMAAWIISTPRGEDGAVDPMQLLSRIELMPNRVNIGEGHPSTSNADPAHLAGSVSVARLSDYIREVVEESTSNLLNEPLNEATISGCIRRLRDHREMLAIREIKDYLLRVDLTVDQRSDALRRLSELMRTQRGSIESGKLSPPDAV